MDIIVVGVPSDGVFEPAFTGENDGPPGGGGGDDDHDSLPPGDDWFGNLMDLAGFDTSDTFAAWNESANNATLSNYSEWMVDGSDVDTFGQEFNINVDGHDFRIENSRAVDLQGNETWITRWLYNGQIAGSTVMTATENGVDIITTDPDGNVVDSEHYAPGSFNLVNGQLVIG